MATHRSNIHTHEDYMNYMYSTERLETKMTAFTQLTLPSITSQIYKPTKWLIFYSKHLPAAYKHRLELAIRPYPFIQLVLVAKYGDIIPFIDQHTPSSPYISVRLDDDDALGINYFSILSANYKPHTIFSPTNGLMLSNYNFHTKLGQASPYSYHANICAASGLAYTDNNIYKLGNHMTIHKSHKNIVYLKEPNLFIRLINESNLSDPKHQQQPSHFSFKNFLYLSNNTTRKKRTPELGEGRSKSIYIEPTVNDTAILIAFYNPARFRRILNNVLYIIKIIKEKNIPCFVVECVFNGAAPQIPNATLVLHSNTYMFYKEQLLNKLEPHVPEQYTKIVALDGDIMFDSPDWVDQISIALNKYDIIQPFDKACWLVPGNQRIKSWKYSYAYGIIAKKFKATETNLHLYHPGFAWAFRRKTFRDLGGLYPNAIIGNGDMLFTYNFLHDAIPDFWVKKTLKTTITIEAWPEYHENFKRVAPKLGYICLRALHLFHGLAAQRQYKTRYSKVAHLLTNKWDDYIVMNKDGLTEFKDPNMRNLLYSYFKGRNEDISVEAAIRFSRAVQKTRKMQQQKQKQQQEQLLNINQQGPALITPPAGQ
jgi:hypothetical protein